MNTFRVRPGVGALILLLLLLPTAAHAGRADDLEREHGTGQIRSGDRRWSQDELKILDASLSVLHSKEKRALKGVDIVRMRTSPRPMGAGLYKVDRRGPRILIYDRAFRGDGRGSSRKPNRTIVHEVGHAMAHWKARRELATANRRVREANAAASAYNAEVRRYNGHVTRYNRSNSSARKAAVDRSRRTLDNMGSDLEKKRRAALRAKREVKRTIRETRPPFVRQGVLAEYRKHLRGRRGPTPYGRRNLNESFAESFSLHYCDPGALTKVLPAVQKWLKKDGHHRAME